ncbi:ribosome maturation factor RimM [Gilvimarinus sp. SDUM040013]|uniref:Ribosome maturation factor RimM n=1 Tax=Gilvimarinus gilvus TaxID=3058038 RepID=A0ABU4RYQ1_9GAMM|nr:ribosome maturation factor RimM [Gilvimarinus sp. SDUM040013]MDO3386997.1 ribosome maturation factor RimM [Gilvimarinus sp. SDUM040013]MDX6848109.1 ribosome maturation factor RimM [Gilvimarinus sp. SDUM040013]
MTTGSSNLVDVGRITAVFGIQGWVKIHSGTEPAENLFEYDPWWLKTAHGVKAVEIDAVRPHGKGFVAHIKGVDDRDQAASYTGTTIAVERNQLPELAIGEFYWHQLQGLSVISRFGDTETRLGCVSRMLETGANDVLVIQADETSVDDRERLVPYIPEQYVLDVNLEAGTITVDWDPDF